MNWFTLFLDRLALRRPATVTCIRLKDNEIDDLLSINESLRVKLTKASVSYKKEKSQALASVKMEINAATAALADLRAQAVEIDSGAKLRRQELLEERAKEFEITYRAEMNRANDALAVVCRELAAKKAKLKREKITPLVPVREIDSFGTPVTVMLRAVL